MSTLKVNTIEPFTGDSVTIVGGQIPTASFAFTASYALNAGADLATYTGSIEQTGGTVNFKGENTIPGMTFTAEDGNGVPTLYIPNANLSSVIGIGVGVNGNLDVNGDVKATGDQIVTGSLTSNGNGIINGTNAGPGTTLDVYDGAGIPKLQVQNATLKGLTGVDVVVNGTAEIGQGLNLPGLGDYVDDAAAATGGVPVNGVYRTGNVLKIRIV